VRRARGSDVLVCANFNAPGQVVLSGSKSAIERAAAVAPEKGLRATALAVAGAFHSPLMAPAAQRLSAALSRTEIREPRCPVYSNVTAQKHAPSAGRTIVDSIRQALVDQLTSPVRWEQSCRHLLSAVPAGAQVHEVAPGVTLAGLMRRIDKPTKVITHDQPE
jgi:[acyl-carrier-protein] S-malonyltransferase